MSMLSACTIGAMASKKDRASSPVRAAIASLSAGEVRGPEATITLDQSAGGNPATSSRSMATSGCLSSRRVTSAENASRSTARAPPAGVWQTSAQAMISDPQARISACSRPTALCSASSERKELEHTSSASPEVWCAAVVLTGRISWRTTRTPA